ncbi:unnamed protein product [Fusarium equiseti]|uniref:Uncharacterized protein n=1 Tax=Fusarium equiseti TaxID=61235 RepID=A0A8J2N765_FUSEQ|nr:unnamed protein product [Fusarium equiseti]
MADSNNTDGGQMNPRQQQAEDSAGNDGRSLVHLLPHLSPVGTQIFELRAISRHVINSKHWHGTDENGHQIINFMHWFTDDEHDGPPVNTITFPDGTTRFLSGANNGQDAEVAETETAD